MGVLGLALTTDPLVSSKVLRRITCKQEGEHPDPAGSHLPLQPRAGPMSGLQEHSCESCHLVYPICAPAMLAPTASYVHITSEIYLLLTSWPNAAGALLRTVIQKPRTLPSVGATIPCIPPWNPYIPPAQRGCV